jgi:hypothetical protein
MSRSRHRDYKVGKGRPPKEHRFKPGQSGNPKGRPKGSKNHATMAKAALGRKVVATVNGSRRSMTVVEIAYRRLADKAMAGDQKALNYLLTLADHVDPAEIGAASNITTEQDLQIINDFMRRHAK